MNFIINPFMRVIIKIVGTAWILIVSIWRMSKLNKQKHIFSIIPDSYPVRENEKRNPG